MTRANILRAQLGIIAHPRSGPPPVTLDPVDIGTNVALSNGNLTATTAGQGISRSTNSLSAGLAYFEGQFLDAGTGNDQGVGIVNAAMSLTGQIGLDGGGNSISAFDLGQLFIAGSAVLLWSSVAVNAGDFCAYAIDFNTVKLWVKNLTSGSKHWNGNAIYDPATNAGGVDFSGISSGPWFAAAGFLHSPGAITMNFGASGFNGVVPSGFAAWDTL